MNGDEKVLEVLQDILRWTKFQGLAQLKELVIQNIVNDDEKRAYNLADGKRSVRAVAAEVQSVSFKTISVWWSKWAALGILEKIDGVQTKYRKIASLESLGIDAPAVKENRNNKESDVDNQEKRLIVNKEQGGEQDG